MFKPQSVLAGCVFSLLISGAALAQDAMIAAQSVAGSATVPVDGDINRFRAVLAETEEGADLFIYTDAGNGWEQTVHARDIVWRGGSYGQEPWLEATEHGSLKLYSENSAIGRDRWEQVLTIAYRGGRFVIAGYTYSHYDTLDPDNSGQCDVNLLTGKGILDGKSFRTSLKTPAVGDWTMDMGPPECVSD
ncbi:hypothetical protein [Labrenzia sp. 011]|uniref:hypothetical protein n=1 Tax=Labrenzia sp. 011 TaxID=2171494 RepID=UPI000D51322A|nr:hypothetical protein [Labrenzia sp. 011]PVB60916.1 hypothetical protein DCO57_14710 [Labrenzia sp. 011]